MANLSIAHFVQIINLIKQNNFAGGFYLLSLLYFDFINVIINSAVTVFELHNVYNIVCSVFIIHM